MKTSAHCTVIEPERIRAIPSCGFATSGQRVFEIEITALQAVQARMDGAFSQACTLMLACQGRVVCMGMGKSGHVARKIAATLASTGTPAFYVHPAEAGHGDLGMMAETDLVLALSYSGASEEILMLLPAFKRQGNVLVSMTGHTQSALAQEADVHLDVGVPAEACPLQLAPTSSTTAMLAMGDALAVALLEARGFTANDFAHSHPSGALGRRLLLRTQDLMHTGTAIPTVSADASLVDALLEMSHKRLGMTAVTTHDGHLLGLFTDGDLRRVLASRSDALETMTVADVMTRHPVTISGQTLAAEAAQQMETHKINALLVVDDDRRLVGALNLHDLLRARVM